MPFYLLWEVIPLNYMNFCSDSYFAADAIAYIQRYNIVVYNRNGRILHRTNFNFQETRYLILTGEHFNRGVIAKIGKGK